MRWVNPVVAHHICILLVAREEHCRKNIVVLREQPENEGNKERAGALR